jgi:hypothetical protein
MHIPDFRLWRTLAESEGRIEFVAPPSAANFDVAEESGGQ